MTREAILIVPVLELIEGWLYRYQRVAKGQRKENHFLPEETWLASPQPKEAMYEDKQV
ncbi:hypothetical protein I79_009281 [Cricetulus griseus]|uniref:Uncharacterized protein n=1 Tax=Cricetulus griseus TaxID=10029 RepID=G3HFC5_CRIGR|nr:hypothetical protein I79_009281 [Cricetulus griseus]